MSSDVGVSRRRAGLAARLQGVLDGAAEVRGADRILAEAFWHTSQAAGGRPPQPTRLAPVLHLDPHRRF